MKKLLFVLMLVLVPCMALGEPFLVCDPYTSGGIPTGFAYSVNGGAEVTVPYATYVAQDDGKTYAKIMDLGPLPNGPFTVSVRAYNVWGSSSAAPFGDTKAVPGSVPNMAIHR